MKVSNCCLAVQPETTGYPICPKCNNSCEFIDLPTGKQVFYKVSLFPGYNKLAEDMANIANLSNSGKCHFPLASIHIYATDELKDVVTPTCTVSWEVEKNKITLHSDKLLLEIEEITIPKKYSYDHED